MLNITPAVLKYIGPAVRSRVAHLWVLGLLAGAAHAQPLLISNVDGGWQNFTQRAPQNAVIANSSGGTDLISWGGGMRSSSYAFTPTAGNITPLLDVPFLMGVFTHTNNDILPPSIDDVEYVLTFTTNGTPGNLEDVLFFDHLETNNDKADPADCRAGVAGPSTSICDDFVTIGSIDLDTTIVVGGMQLFFNLLGFSTDGGTTISNEFQSPEAPGGSVNSAGLYAMVSLLPLPVPAPGGVIALLTMLGLLARRYARYS